MKKIPVTNRTTGGKTVGDVSIAPGCARMIERSRVPGATDETTAGIITDDGLQLRSSGNGASTTDTTTDAAPNAADVALAKILELNVDEVQAEIEELPLSDLKRLLEIENGREKSGWLDLKGGPRKGVTNHLEALIALREEDDTGDVDLVG